MRGTKGNAIVEFALSWALISMIFTGVYQFGYSLYIYNSLQTAVSGAAKLGQRIDYDTGNPTAYATKLKNMVLYGDTTAGTSPIIPGLTASHVMVTPTLVGGIPTAVTVAINGYTINAIVGTMTLNEKPSVTMPYSGLITCASC
jgi:hypothetical protein